MKQLFKFVTEENCEETKLCLTYPATNIRIAIKTNNYEAKVRSINYLESKMFHSIYP